MKTTVNFCSPFYCYDNGEHFVYFAEGILTKGKTEAYHPSTLFRASGWTDDTTSTIFSTKLSDVG